MVNIPLTPRTFEEDFLGPEGIISGDNTRISFAVNVTSVSNITTNLMIDVGPMGVSTVAGSLLK